MSKTDIKSFDSYSPMMYAYSTPEIHRHDGYLKIGMATTSSVEHRVWEQTHTADIKAVIEWKDFAMYKDGTHEYFPDIKFHNYLKFSKKIKFVPHTEWFEIDVPKLQQYFSDFSWRKDERNNEHDEYTLFDEQEQAVEMTKKYFENGGSDFLWNAKPRFGKTYAAYGLIETMGLKKVLIVSNRPSVSNPWMDFYFKYISWKDDFRFISDNEKISKRQDVLTRNEFVKRGLVNKSFIAFESLQGLKGSMYFGGNYDKLKWMAKEYRDGNGNLQHGIEFDLLIVDEAQEGVDTMLTDNAFENIARKHTLYLSGTPFKALASDKFEINQIFNWSYADEQRAKENWTSENSNPYEDRPQISLFTYKLSDMIAGKIEEGAQIGDEVVDYTFDLGEFFKTNNNGNFIYEDEVRKFISALKTNGKYPFSTPQLRSELPHTLWLLNRVDSAKALAKLLKEDDVFKDYEIVIAAGDGRLDNEDSKEESYSKVINAIKSHDKTITLSVGQLTVGVTIPQWSGVMMLCNLNSASSYMQAAFRAQTPYSYSKGDKLIRKDRVYIFDFDPVRTLTIYDQFANDLSVKSTDENITTEKRNNNIRELLNFFPVIGEDDEGKMIELDAKQVLTVPVKIESKEVVRHGFISNFLFQNITNVFGAPQAVEDILKKLPIAHEEQKSKDNDVKSIPSSNEINISENGEIHIPEEIIIGQTQDLFGNGYYKKLDDSVVREFNEFNESLENSSNIKLHIDNLYNAIDSVFENEIINKISEKYKDSAKEIQKIRTETKRDIKDNFNKIALDYSRKSKIAETELKNKQKSAQTDVDLAEAESAYQITMKEALEKLNSSLLNYVDDKIKNKPREIVEQVETHKKEKEKDDIESMVKDHLRGFTRTIPSFVMAYGDETLTLASFDSKVEEEVFKEVTGISIDEFRFLRDGGDYTDPGDGTIKHFEGHLFKEEVFNESILEFLRKKSELADYFDENQKEDIFDYIPPQKTNQIFTPRFVVKQMVDELGKENPGCFDDPDNTFADLYMKSGLYITEIVKRLYNSSNMKKLFPNELERLNHIFDKQIYGMAPTKIIYLISTNYILGFDKKHKIESKHFVQADAAEAAKRGTLEELVNQCFGNFDI